MKLICHLKNIYYRLFYFFFRIEKRDNQGGEETDRFAAVVAILPMSILCCSGFFTLLYLISRFVIPMRLPSGTFFILFAIVDIGLNSFLFFRKRRYLKIKELFSQEDDDRRFKRSFWCIVFTILILNSMFILIGLFGNPWVK
jgi:hypothetical protein